MTNLIQVVIILVFPMMLYSQVDVKETFYKDPYLQKKTKERKAKFKEVIETKGDTVTTKRIKIKNDKVYYYKSVVNGEPIGLWFKQFPSQKLEETDYRFTMTIKNLCEESSLTFDGGNLLAPDDKIGYTPPVLKGKETNFRRYFQRLFRVPLDFARSGETKAKTVLNFTLNKEGEIEQMSIAEPSSSKLIDKEALRTLRNVQFEAPATVNGEAVDICISLTVNVVVR